MTKEERLEQFFIHLPTDAKSLTKLVKIFAREAAELDLASLHTAHKAVVKTRSMTPAKAKKIKERLLAENSFSVFVNLSEGTIRKYSKNFEKIYIDYPGAKEFAAMIHEELRILGYLSFTYMELLQRIEKRKHIVIPGKMKLKPFVYGLLKASFYTRVLRYTIETRRSVSVFSLGEIV